MGRGSRYYRALNAADPKRPLNEVQYETTVGIPGGRSFPLAFGVCPPYRRGFVPLCLEFRVEFIHKALFSYDLIKRSSQEITTLIEEYRRSGQTRAEFCQSHGLALSSFQSSMRRRGSAAGKGSVTSFARFRSLGRVWEREGSGP